MLSSRNGMTGLKSLLMRPVSLAALMMSRVKPTGGSWR